MEKLLKNITGPEEKEKKFTRNINLYVTQNDKKTNTHENKDISES
jgi:hypothetical protein